MDFKLIDSEAAPLAQSGRLCASSTIATILSIEVPIQPNIYFLINSSKK